MIFLCNAQGTITSVIPEPINQGSIGVNRIVLIAPYPKSTVISATFTLPNGMKLYPQYVGKGESTDYDYLMSAVESFDGKGLTIDGVTVNVWQLPLDKALTQLAGKVTVQFLAMGNGGVVLGSTSTEFNVNKGNPYLTPSVSVADLNTIAEYLTAAKTAMQNAETAQGKAEEAQGKAEAAQIIAENAKTGAVDAFVSAAGERTATNVYFQKTIKYAGEAEEAKNNALLYKDDAQVSANAAYASEVTASGYAFTASQQAAIAKDNADRYSPWDVVATQSTAYEALRNLQITTQKSHLFLNVDFSQLNLNIFDFNGAKVVLVAQKIEKIEFRGCKFEDEQGNPVELEFRFQYSQCSITGAKGDALTINGFTDVIDCRANIIKNCEYVTACDAGELIDCECVSDTTIWNDHSNCIFVDPYTVNGFVPSSDVGKVPKLTGDGTYAPAPLPQSISISLNSSTYELTLALKDANNNVIGTPVTVDLPIESMIVGASVNGNGDIVLKLQNGQTITVPASAIVQGLASEAWVLEQIRIAGTGATFIPSVSPEGIISWTNDKGLPNPTPRNIKGDAYVLTSADKQEIGNIVLGNSLNEIETAKNNALSDINTAQQSNIVQTVGTATDKVMSQKVVTGIANTLAVVFISNSGKLFVERDSAYAYIKSTANIVVINRQMSINSFTWNKVLENIPESYIATSPTGEVNCIALDAELMGLVYNVDTKQFAVKNMYQLDSFKEIVLFAQSYNEYVGCLYSKAEEVSNTLATVYLHPQATLYSEYLSENQYIKVESVSTNSSVLVRNLYFGSLTYLWSDIIASSSISNMVTTSPAGKDQCVRIPSGSAFVYDVLTRTFSVKLLATVDSTIQKVLFFSNYGACGGCLYEQHVDKLNDTARNTLASIDVETQILKKTVANLEGATLDFVEDSSTVYEKNVPSNALPYAKVAKVGGMTYKVNDTLRHAAVTALRSKNVNLVDSFSIPSEVQAIAGYGRGVNSYSNYIDYDRKTFIREVFELVFDGTEQWVLQGINAAGLSNFSIFVNDNKARGGLQAICNKYPISEQLAANAAEEGVFMNSTTLFIRTFNHRTVDAWKTYLSQLYMNGTPVVVDYALETAQEVDVSAYISDDNYIKVQGGGTITAVNEYGLAAPTTIDFVTDIGG